MPQPACHPGQIRKSSVPYCPRLDSRAFAAEKAFWRICILVTTRGLLAHVVIQRISGAANCSNGVGQITYSQGLAQPSNMHIDGTGVYIDVASPCAVKQLVATLDSTGPFHECSKQSELGWPEPYMVSAPGDFVLFLVQNQIAICQFVVSGRTRPAQNRIDPRQ